MTRVRCLFRQCLLNEAGTCTAIEIELDRDGVCLTVEESDAAEFAGDLAEDSMPELDEWDEDEDDEWDEDIG